MTPETPVAQALPCRRDPIPRRHQAPRQCRLPLKKRIRPPTSLGLISIRSMAQDFSQRLNELPEGWLQAMGVTITKATAVFVVHVT